MRMPVTINDKLEIKPKGESNIFTAFLKENVGKMLWMDLVPLSKSKWTEDMYGYYHSTVLPVATKFFRDEGYDVSQEEADDMLIAMFSRKPIYNKLTGEAIDIDVSKKEQSKDDGVNFINRVIRVCAENGYVVPPADKEWWKHSNRESIKTKR